MIIWGYKKLWGKKTSYDSICNHRTTFENMAEEEGFEPPRRLPDLPHFECGPFSLLGTPPCFTTLFKEIFHQLATFISEDACLQLWLMV